LHSFIIKSSSNLSKLIPRNFLVDDSYVLNKKNEKIKVSVGLMDYKKAEILDGLKPSDIILKPLK
jgi:hypothetical protein